MSTIWPTEHSDLLRDLCAAAEPLSSSEIASALNEKFGTTYTRMSVIGRVSRAGLQLKLNQHGETRKPRVRPIRTNPFEARWQPKKPAEPIAMRCAAVEPLHLSEPEAGKCKYPYGDGPFTFCGHATERTYCDLHHELCWVKPVRRSGPLAPFPHPPTARPKAAFMRVGGAWQ